MQCSPVGRTPAIPRGSRELRRRRCRGRPRASSCIRRAPPADVLELLAPLLGPQLRAALIAELEARYAGSPPGLAADERQRRLAELDSEIARLETLEERAIQAASEGGMEVARRPDASPAALLGIANDHRSLVVLDHQCRR